MARWVLAVVLSLLPVVAVPARAETPTQVSADVMALSRALMIPETMEILRAEGLANGRELGGEMPPGRRGSLWGQALDRVYDPARMLSLFDQAFAVALAEDGETVAAATAFFGTEPGRRALALELSARRALLDKTVEAAARLAYGRLASEDSARQALIDRFVRANDLVDSNVMGAMNANLAFLRGLAEAGGDGFAASEADMLAQVWGTEAETRAETVGWLFPFLAMAYQPMSDADLTTYVAFSESPAGRRLNAAMFKAFDAMLNAVSRDLGRAFGRSLQGDDI